MPAILVAWKALATISSKSPYLSKEKQINVVQNSLILKNISYKFHQLHLIVHVVPKLPLFSVHLLLNMDITK